MEDDEKIVAPEEVVNASTEAAGDNPDLDTAEPKDTDRISVVEGQVDEINERLDDIVTEQEKIVTVLDKISDKILSTEPSPKAVEAAKENALKDGDFGGAVPLPETPAIDTPAEEAAETTAEEPAETVAEEPTEEIVAEEPTQVEETPAEEQKAEDESEEEKVEQTEEPAPEDEPAEEEAPEEKPAEEEEKEEPKAKKTRKTKKADKETNNKETKMTKEELQEILNSFKADVVNEILDAKVEEPEVKEAPAEEEAKEETPEIAQNWRQRYNDQVAAAWDFHRLNNIEAGKKLQAINQYNANLKVQNDAGTAPMTITSLADFVLPPEMDREIHGLRTNYSPFLGILNYQQTNNLQFMYATRVGDINMQNVKFCDDQANGNLKPVETYELRRGIAQMEEMAAVTPICDNATKYMAVDILQDVAAGYRNDYDRKLAQLAIVRFQQALNETGNTVEYDPATAVDSLVDFVKATTLVSEGVVNGKFIFNARTKALILENMLRSANDGLGQTAFTTGDTQTIWGYDYVVVPNDLLPTLGTNEVKQFKALNNQTGVIETVDITSPVFYGDFNEYRGKVNGGLNYTVSTDAAYEINGTVYSAYQRDELVIRGYFYRGGYIADPTVIAGLVPASS